MAEFLFNSSIVIRDLNTLEYFSSSRGEPSWSKDIANAETFDNIYEIFAKFCAEYYAMMIADRSLEFITVYKTNYDWNVDYE